MSVLLAYGAQVLSVSGAVSGWLSIGTSVSGVPRHNDGILGLGTAANEITVAFAVDLLDAKAPDLMGFFNHNISAGAVVRVQASSGASFSSLIVDQLVTVASPNFWKDLRSITPRTARYWRGLVTGNANPVKLGELVVAQATAIDCYQWEYTDIRDYLEYTYGSTDFGALVRQKQNITIRARQVRWAGPDTLAETLQDVSDYAGRYPGPVILVPDDTVNDIWFLDWPETFARGQVIDNRQEVEILLQEQSPGAR